MKISIINQIASSSITESLITILVIFVTSVGYADGKFLRGEVDILYSIEGKTADFYVSTAGNDRWSGTLAEPNPARTDGPFATLGKAKQAVRQLKKQIYKLKEKAIDPRFRPSPHKFGSGRDILVLIREGNYTLKQTIEFTCEDGGERVETDLPTGAFELHKLKDYYVTYAAYPGESPVITGGQRIQGWQQGTNGKWQVLLEVKEVLELFADGQRQTLARIPNKGYLRTQEQPTDTKSFRYKKNDLQVWPEMGANRIIIVSRWSSDITSITRIDEKNRIAYLKTPAQDMINVPPKYYVENVEALLDTTGEWYFDQKKQILSYIPPENVKNPQNMNIVFPGIASLLRIAGDRENPVRNLRLYNLSFAVTKPGDIATISLEHAKNCELLSNSIRNISQTAIYLGRGCYHNLIHGNKIYDVKGSGIRVSGDARPVDWNDVVSDNVVTWNEVIHCRPAAGGIGTANALRTTIAHNYVTDTGSYGITAGSWSNVEEASDGNHLVAYNHVSFTNMIRDDEGGMAVYGLSPGSIVRNNLIHDVRPAATNENVGFFFQNMASGWTVKDNIYYNLKQGEMKLCACYLIDNIYENNQVIEPPTVEPERIISSEPDFFCTDLQILSDSELLTGKELEISARVRNNGSTGTAAIPLYIDGKTVISQNFPIISNNERMIKFIHQFSVPGKHLVAIGNTPNTTISVEGEPLQVLYSDLSASMHDIPEGEPVIIRFKVQYVGNGEKVQTVTLFVNGKAHALKDLLLFGGKAEIVTMPLQLPVGQYQAAVGKSVLHLRVYETKEVVISSASLSTYCSSTAAPCQYDFDVEENRFEISAHGTDFLHAEDSYGTIFLKDVIKGNFIATVQVAEFGERVSEWCRAGLFVRNDLTKSNETERGSLGSFLMFSTPKREGAQWDAFGDGSMHNTKSRNYKKEKPLPVWLKLIRHGDRFSGFYSHDGKNWQLSRKSGPLPGLAERMDIGLAAGTNDQKLSKVTFKDFMLKVESDENRGSHE